MALANLVVGSLTLTDDRGRVQVYKLEPLNRATMGEVTVVEVLGQLEEMSRLFVDKVWGSP